MRQSLDFIRSRRFASTSMALRINETRSSPSSSRASRRAVVPSANGRVIRSGNSLRRPTRRGISYVCESVNQHLFVCTLLTMYHRYDISSIVDTNGDAEMTDFTSDEHAFAFQAAADAAAIAEFEAQQVEEEAAAKFRAYCKEMGVNS